MPLHLWFILTFTDAEYQSERGMFAWGGEPKRSWGYYLIFHVVWWVERRAHSDSSIYASFFFLPVRKMGSEKSTFFPPFGNSFLQTTELTTACYCSHQARTAPGTFWLCYIFKYFLGRYIRTETGHQRASKPLLRANCFLWKKEMGYQS